MSSCPAPHPQTPPPASSVLHVSSSDSQVLSAQSPFLLPPCTDSPSRTGCSSRASNQRTGFFAICPHQPFQFVPTPPGCLSHAGSVVALSHTCLSVGTAPSVPGPGDSVPGQRWQVKARLLPFPLFLQGEPVSFCLPTALRGLHWTF